MKKWLVILLAVVLLTACGGNESASNEENKLTVDEYKTRVEKVLKEVGDKTSYEILSSEEIEKNKHAFALADDVAIFLDINENGKVDLASVAVKPTVQTANIDDFNFAFELLIGTADETLALGDRTKLGQELGLYDEETFLDTTVKSKKNNDITFTFKGDPNEVFVLEAKY